MEIIAGEMLLYLLAFIRSDGNVLEVEPCRESALQSPSLVLNRG